MRMLLLLALLVSSSSWATDKHVPKNPLSPTPTIIYRSGDDHGMAGLLIGAVGLMWQAFRNVWFLVTGESMTDNDWPMWYLKDFCFFMIAAHSV